jgi:primase-polymerase (primpol)-like protein
MTLPALKALPAALAPFGAYKQFIIYKAVLSESRPGKTDKFPIDHATGRIANAHNSSIWLSFDRASEIAAKWGEPFGVGFVFTGNYRQRAPTLA